MHRVFYLALVACGSSEPGRYQDKPPELANGDALAPSVDPPSTSDAGDDGGDDDASADDPLDASATPDATSSADASEDGARDDADAPPNVCPTALAPGDLAIDELMIESLAGTGDHGEWLEVRSTRDCALNLRGLHAECPRGAKVVTLDVTEDRLLAPRGTFVIADSGDPAINHSLPGVVIAWEGNLGDVLRNKGTTITLRMGGAIIETLTYPQLALTVGASIAFPSDCAPASRDSWTSWQTSASSWFPGFLGTPNAPNTDVHCPQ